MSYASTIRKLERDLEKKRAKLREQDQLRADIARLEDAISTLQELEANTPTEPRRSGSRGVSTGPANDDWRQDPGTDGVCDKQGADDLACDGGVNEYECEVDGCAFRARRCQIHGGNRTAAMVLGHHRRKHRDLGELAA